MNIAPVLEECARLAIAYAEGATVRRTPVAGHRIAYYSAIVVFTALAGLASLACAVTALWIALLPSCGAAGAPAVIAVLLLAACMCLLGLLWHGQRAREVPPVPAVGVSSPMTGEQTVPWLISAVLAGLAMGSSRK